MYCCYLHYTHTHPTTTTTIYPVGKEEDQWDIEREQPDLSLGGEPKENIVKSQEKGISRSTVRAAISCCKGRK